MLLSFLCGCGNSLKSRVVIRSSDSGISYSCALVEVSSGSAPIIVLGRYVKGVTNQFIEWKSSQGRFYVEGIQLKPVSEPTLYFRKDGKTQTKAISKSGPWLPLFSDDGPTFDDMERAFAKIENER